MRRSGTRRGRFHAEFCAAMSSRRSTPACRSRCWPACMSAAYELFGQEGIRSIADLKGKSVGRAGPRVEPHICSYRSWRPMSGSTRPRTSIGSPSRLRSSRSSCSPKARSTPSSAFRPSRRNCAPGNIGHVIVNSSVDRPWSQYFCCMLAGNREYRAQKSGRDETRAARHPEGCRPLRQRAGARRATSGRWRFHAALRLCAADDAAKCRTTNGASTTPRTRSASTRCGCTMSGSIKSSPQKIIADGTDWRFLERAQTRAEGVSAKGEGGFQCR